MTLNMVSRGLNQIYSLVDFMGLSFTRCSNLMMNQSNTIYHYRYNEPSVPVKSKVIVSYLSCIRISHLTEQGFLIFNARIDSIKAVFVRFECIILSPSQTNLSNSHIKRHETSSLIL